MKSAACGSSAVVGAGPLGQQAYETGVEERWTKQQEEVRDRIILDDALDFDAFTFAGLSHIGGLDISFDKKEATRAFATLVVLTYPGMLCVYEHTQEFHITQPYVPGFLAFRECAPLLELISALRASNPHVFPQVILVDGNGVLHPRGCGVACHLGVKADVVAVGVAKSFLHVDGMTKSRVMDAARLFLRQSGDWFPLLGASGRVWGGALLGRDASEGPRQCARHRRAKTAVGSPAAARVGVDEETSIASARAEMVDVTMSLTGDGDVDEDKVHAEPAQIPRVGANKTGGGGNPIFVSPGHKISLGTAIRLVLTTCVNARVPEPIRQADLRIAEFFSTHTPAEYCMRGGCNRVLYARRL